MRRITYLLVCLTLLLYSALSTSAQKPGREISGVVTDSKGVPLFGATVNLKGTQKGAATNAEGKFTLKITGSHPVLLVSSVGYEDQEVAVGESASLDIKLNIITKKIEEVVVIGYGTVKRKDLTGSVSSVNSDHLTLDGPVTNVGQALQGRAAGVQVQQSDFSPGAGLNIVVRGGNSVNSTNGPLYVVDGFISDNGQYINPNDIENIQILKDASSTAIFGARGSNGVIMITTKKGKNGKVVVEGDASKGWQSLTYHPGLITGEQYQSIQNAIAVENATTPPFGASFPTANTNWYKLGTRTATVENEMVSISSGDQGGRMYASIGYTNQDGVLRHTDMQRVTARVGAEKTLNSGAKVGASVYAASRNSDLQKYSGDITAPLYSLLTYGTNIPVYNANGTYYQYLGKDNPLATLLEPTNTEANKLINGTIYLDYDIIKHLTYHIDGGGEFNQTTDGQYIPLSLVAGAANGGVAAEQMSTAERWLTQQYLTYKYMAGDHSLTAMLGYTNQKDLYYTLGAGSKGYSTDLYLNNNLSAGATSYPAPTSSKNEIKRNGIFGRLNYSYKEKLLATFTFRRDGSSAFGANKRNGYFPSGALAYRFTDEGFLKKYNIYSLKARLSYGATGNDQIGYYPSLSRWTNYNTVLSTGGVLSGGSEPAALANPNLQWESAKQFDAGFDLGVSKGKINITIDYYRKTTSNLFLSVPVGQWWGFSSQTANAGSIRNQGIEFSVTTDNITTKDFSWNTTFNAAYNRQKVLSLPPSISYISYTTANPSGVVSAQEFTRLVPGKELGMLYGYKYDGVIKSGENDAAQPLSKPGDPKYKDLNGNGSITPDDRTYLGNTTPHYIAGFSNDFRYKGFDLSIFFQGAFGYHLYDMNRLVMESTTGKAVLDRFVAGSHENTSVPRDGYFLSTYGSYVNSRFVENASYVRLKNVALGYSLPKSLTNHVSFLEAIRFYASAQNVFKITGYKGTDPEVNVHSGSNIGGGLDFTGFPAFRTFIVGAKLTIH